MRTSIVCSRRSSGAWAGRAWVTDTTHERPAEPAVQGSCMASPAAAQACTGTHSELETCSVVRAPAA